MPNTPKRELEILPVDSVLPWRSGRLALRPYSGFWAFNPSIHFDGETWRCAVRCADYGMPGGVQIRGPEADKLGVQTRNVMCHLDPATWQVSDIFPMQELDNLPRNRAGNRGFEDIRLFWTETGGLQGIACSAHLEREKADHFPPEQVILSFDDEYNIVEAKPIRGAAWGGPQKNWSPFDRAMEPRFLYSIPRSIVFDQYGPVDDVQAEEPEPEKDKAPPNPLRGAMPVGGAEFRNVQRIQAVESKAMGRREYTGLRGGTQLHYLHDQDVWLGLGHEMRLERNRKLYWHRFYATDSNGKLLSISPCIKICPKNGIEFAAGMVIHDDRIIISMGVDDSESHLGETELAAVLEILEPIVETDTSPPPSRASGLVGGRRSIMGTSSSKRGRP